MTDLGPLDAATLLLRWYRELREVRDADDPEERPTVALQREYELGMLEHHVLYAISRMLPSSPVDMSLIEPTKARGELDLERLARVPTDEPDPVVVMERPGEGKLKLMDGHHRFYVAKDAGHGSIPAVRLDSSLLLVD